MTHPRIVLTKFAHSLRLKSVRTGAALMFATLTLLVLAATTAAMAQTYNDFYNFDGTHGSTPYGVLAQGRNGNWYGTTWNGGIHDDGVVYAITPGGKLKVLDDLDGDQGSFSRSGLTLGRDGSFYGTAENGGANGYGTIFKITPGGSLTRLYSFTGGTDGAYPRVAPIQGTDGNFYGTTDRGSAYKITPSGTFALLGALPGGSAAPLLQAVDGNFYGTSYQNDGMWGAVFKITPEGIVTIVYNFAEGALGAAPMAPVIQGSDGNLYGTTYQGGIYGAGIVFKLTLHGAITVLHNFGDPNHQNDGANPEGGLVQATDGNYYGATDRGGTIGGGVIFQLTVPGAYSILYNFDGAHGLFPDTTPAQHTDGKLYGLALEGPGLGLIYSFDVGLGPFVSLVSTSGKVGVPIEILGQGFTGTTAVSFHGTPATFKVWSDTFLKAAVPSGTTTGPVTVTTPGGTLTSNHEFRVHPVILTVTPSSGSAGTPVVITGTSFTQTTKVTFGGGKAAATFTVDSDTQVTATIPAGTPAGYIVLTTAGGRSKSPDTFTVTP